MAGFTIINGKVYEGANRPKDKPHDATVADIEQSGRLERAYRNHAHDLIQPYNPDGTPNQDFINYYPQDAVRYGFIKEDNSNGQRTDNGRQAEK